MRVAKALPEGYEGLTMQFQQPPHFLQKSSKNKTKRLRLHDVQELIIMYGNIIIRAKNAPRQGILQQARNTLIISGVAICRFLACKRRQNAMQKTAFHNAKSRLLEFIRKSVELEHSFTTTYSTPWRIS